MYSFISELSILSVYMSCFVLLPHCPTYFSFITQFQIRKYDLSKSAPLDQNCFVNSANNFSYSSLVLELWKNITGSWIRILLCYRLLWETQNLKKYLFSWSITYLSSYMNAFINASHFPMDRFFNYLKNLISKLFFGEGGHYFTLQKNEDLF